jgi:hypothetical protein
MSGKDEASRSCPARRQSRPLPLSCSTCCNVDGGWGEKGDWLPEDSSEPEEREKIKRRKKGIMKKNFGVSALTCLAAVFTIFMVLTPGFAKGKTAIPPTKPPVDVKPADLPDNFNQLKIGMTSEQVKGLLGYPATIRPMGQGKREWKYFIRNGEARLFLNFQDNKIVSLQQLTP